MPPTPTPPPAPQRKRILIVEDDLMLQDLMARGVMKGPYDVEIAPNLTEATRLIEAHQPDLVVLDLLLPDANGLEFASKLRQQEATRTLPLIVYSNIDDPESRKKAQELHVVHYFVKAQSMPSELLETITSYFNANP